MRTTRNMAEENIHIPIRMFIMAIGIMESDMEKGNICTKKMKECT